MARGMIIGTTDYSNQSINAMKEDLKNWVVSLRESCDIINRNIEKLKQNNYWVKVDFDFQSSCSNLIRLLIQQLKIYN